MTDETTVSLSLTRILRDLDAAILENPTDLPTPSSEALKGRYEPLWCKVATRVASRSYHNDLVMALRLDEQETEALRRRVELERRSMQEVARQGGPGQKQRTSRRELLDCVLDDEQPRCGSVSDLPVPGPCYTTRGGHWDGSRSATPACWTRHRPGPAPQPSWQLTAVSGPPGRSAAVVALYRPVASAHARWPAGQPRLVVTSALQGRVHRRPVAEPDAAAVVGELGGPSTVSRVQSGAAVTSAARS
jgi:hypothetical protein